MNDSKNKSLTTFAKREINTIHSYSRKYNRLLGRDHFTVLLELMRKHVAEIATRYKKRDKHYITETGDLLILCFELLKESKCLPDAILSRCYKRYHKKLSDFLKSQHT